MYRSSTFVMQSAGLQAMDEIIPTLLEALEDDEMSTTALDGLKQIIRFSTTVFSGSSSPYRSKFSGLLNLLLELQC